MRRFTAGFFLVAGVVSTGITPAFSEDSFKAESALIDQATLPEANDLKGARPKADPFVLAPAVVIYSETSNPNHSPLYPI